MALAMERLHGAFCAGGDLRRPSRPDDRRAARQPAGHRLWRRRDVSGLRRPGAGAADPAASAIWRKATGRSCRRTGARIFNDGKDGGARRSGRPRCPAPLIGKGNYRHFMEKEICEQPAVIGDTLHSFIDPADAARSNCRDCRSIWAKVPRLTIARLRHRLSMPAWSAKYWFEQVARLPVDVDVASEFRYRDRADAQGRRDAVGLPVGRDGRHAGGAALRRRRQGRRSSPSSTCRKAPWRAKPTPCCRRWRGRRSASPRPRPSPPSWRCWPAWRSAAARARGAIGDDARGAS